MNITITLTNSEYKAAVDCANMRMFTSNEAGWNNASVQRRTHAKRMQDEIVGACGEIALCKHMKMFWSPSVNTFHAIPDVGSNIEVRATDQENGSLIVRDNDADDRWYILVTGEPPTMTIRGRIKGSAAKQTQFLRDPHSLRPAWFVPQNALFELPKPVR